MLIAGGRQTFAASKTFFCIIPTQWRLHHLLAHSQHALDSCVPVISDQGQKASASLGCYQMCISWHSNKEPPRITTSTRWRGVSDLLVVGAQSNTFSLPRETECHSACLSGVKWQHNEKKVWVRGIFMTLSAGRLCTLRRARAHTPLQSVHCENRRVPASLNSSHRQQSRDCQFHAWLIVITRRETKKGERNAFQD